jgi:hypothetical protein
MPFQENSQQPWEIEPAKSPADLAHSIPVSRFSSGIRCVDEPAIRPAEPKLSCSRIVNKARNVNSAQARVGPPLPLHLSGSCAITSSIVNSKNVTVGDIEHYAITVVQIVASSRKARPQETGL